MQTWNGYNERFDWVTWHTYFSDIIIGINVSVFRFKFETGLDGHRIEMDTRQAYRSRKPNSQYRLKQEFTINRKPNNQLLIALIYSKLFFNLFHTKKWINTCVSLIKNSSNSAKLCQHLVVDRHQHSSTKMHRRKFLSPKTRWN